MSAHGQRGQSLPITAIGIIALLAVGYFSIDYANTIRWQIRAQSAADSAAQAILSIQTQQFNEMTATLYAAAVEEYRIRRNLNAMAMAANLQGGCAAGYDVTNPAGLAGAQSQCEPVYAALQSRFTQAVARYGSEVELLNEITSSLNLPNVVRDSSALVQQLNVGCNGATADCAFGYTIPSGAITARTDTVNVKMDALGIEKPWNATSATSPSGVNANLCLRAAGDPGLLRLQATAQSSHRPGRCHGGDDRTRLASAGHQRESEQRRARVPAGRALHHSGDHRPDEW